VWLEEHAQAMEDGTATDVDVMLWRSKMDYVASLEKIIDESGGEDEIQE
jgi:hypothetical protein